MTGYLATALITRLIGGNTLDGEDIQAIQELPIQVRQYDARKIVTVLGDRSTECFFLAEGFVFRSKTTAEGQRQIVSIHIPGEIPDLQTLHLHVMDHDITTLTPCTLGFVSHDALKRLNARHAKIAAALWRETLVDAAIFREWTVNVGRRSAVARLAHLFAELHRRLGAIGRIKNGAVPLPMTQTELADCLGLTTVHVNRMLQTLRREGILTSNRAGFHILKQEQLEQLADFEPTYLHQRLALQ
jgi:CRP-like cAMP-binding protein